MTRSTSAALVSATLAVIAAQTTGRGQAGPTLLTIRPEATSELRTWDAEVDRRVREGTLVLAQRREDTLVPGRIHERLAQYHDGVAVFGGEVTRQLDGGQTVSVFGTLYANIEVDPTPVLDPQEARARVEALAGTELDPARRPELLILPLEDRYALVYRVRVALPDDLATYFIDARTGEVVLRLSDLKTVVGIGRGVLDDRKKISVQVQTQNRYLARDELRPPVLVTYDMQGNLTRVLRFLNGLQPLTDNDLAADSDNDWGDGAVVDAHVYAGWTYDYLFKRFGRRGLDNHNLGIRSLVHPVRRDDVLQQPGSIIGTFYLNAFYAGDGVMVYGEGLPSHLTAGGRRWNFLAGALDVVAHELGHGVTEFSSNLIYRDEPGALNEAFSDILAVGAEFFFQPPGEGPLRADYLIGEDVVTPGGIRSLENPAAYGNPDHYSRRFTGREDNGGVHINSGIPGHAFYLAIEGGVNRTSGLGVQGVGRANREQIERVFYRAFVQLLPSNATFALARAACIQAARDLYGSTSAAARAVEQAWSAVGVP
jgi:bacillolysin